MALERQQASKGYKVVANTAATAKNFFGLSVLADAVITTIIAPTTGSPDQVAYDGDEAGLAGPTLPPGYYPIRGSSITLASGSVILWTE